MICSEAVIQPTRIPGAMTLEKESMRITRPSMSMLRREGTRVFRNWSWEAGGGMSGALGPVYGCICRK